jgi:mitochondrial chaperone BCS1
MGGLIKGLASNTVFTGLAGSMLMGSLLYLLRAIPTRLWHFAYEASTVTLTVTSDDAVFDCINEWFAEHDYAQRARRLKVSTKRNSDDEYTLAPGMGTHVFWQAGRPMIIERTTDDKHTGGWRPTERYTVTAFGRSQARVRELLLNANEQRVEKRRLGIHIWHGGYWQRMPSKAKRAIESVYLLPEIKDELLRYVAWFFGAKAWHELIGLPHRTGVMLEGPTGTGKSTIVAAIGSFFNKVVYVINLASVESDNALVSAFMQCEPSCIVLLEDVDCIGVTHKREEAAPTPAPIETVAAPPGSPPSASAPKSEEKKGITLSGLLNAIDGLTATEGRIVFMTTNHIDKLDSALIREARIDLRFHIGPLTPALVGEMAARFFDGDAEQITEWVGRASASESKPGAYWQKMMKDQVVAGVSNRAATQLREVA